MKYPSAAGILLLLGALTFPAFAELPLLEFVAKARNPNQGSTYAKLTGTLQHRRSNRDAVSMPIYFGVILQPERITGQLILNNTEAYLIGQKRSVNSGTLQRMQGSAATDHLGEAGVRASDLTMGFLFWPLVRELPRQSMSGGMIPCRIVQFRSPDRKELVHVWLSAEHIFPLKAEFFRPGEEKPFRTLETGGYTKRNDLYYVSKIRIEGPGWRTRIDFDTGLAELGVFDTKKPQNIIRALPAKAK